MKSGIGPKEVLEAAKIPLKQDLPGVCQNLRDHAAVVLGFTATNPNRNVLPRINEVNVERELNRYQSNKKSGFFTRLDVGPQGT
jgi:choline dehydrogenase-like flavoprotein